MAAGDAVFEARGMLGMQEALNFDDVDLCTQQGYFMRKALQDSAATEIAYHMYPVPAISELSLLKTGAAWEEEQLEILDLQGRMVSKIAMPKGGSVGKMNVNSLSSGFYFARIFSRDGQLKHSQKISIVK